MQVEDILLTTHEFCNNSCFSFLTSFRLETHYLLLVNGFAPDLKHVVLSANSEEQVLGY